MKIAWTHKAELKYINVLAKTREDFGWRSAVKLNQEVNDILQRIKRFPTSARIEPLLTPSSHDFEFRSVPFGSHNKLVYHVEEPWISIDNIWDTRREPQKQAED